MILTWSSPKDEARVLCITVVGKIGDGVEVVKVLEVGMVWIASFLLVRLTGKLDCTRWYLIN